MIIDRDEIIELLSRAPIFSELSESDLPRLAGLFEVEMFDEGEVIFNLADLSEKVYVVYEGQVELISEISGVPGLIARLQPGDVFGEEALLYDDPRFYASVAHQKTILLSLDVNNYLYISEAVSEIETIVEISVHSRWLSTQIKLPWLHEDEYVHVMTRRHPAILWSKLVIPIVIGLGAFLVSALLQWQWLPEKYLGLITFAISLPVMIIWLAWIVIDWRNDFFIVTNKRVVWIEKVVMIYESRQEAPLRTIMSVGMNRSRIGSVLGYADVVVMTYVGTIRFQKLAHAEAVASLIESYWHRSEFRDRREEAQVMALKLGEKLNLPGSNNEQTRAGVTRVVQQETQVFNKEPGFFAWLFSDFIRLRYESDGAITYRKHWFVLIKNIWLPLLLTILSLAALVARLGGMLTFLPITATSVIFLLILFGFFVWTVYQYADWRNDVFQVTLDQIIDIDRKPLGKVRRRSAPLENVLSIEYERLGFWGFLFNFGTVYISVGNMKLSFDHVFNPSEVQQDIFYRMGERLEKIRQFEIESERDRFSEWISSYHKKTKGSQKAGGDNQIADE